MTVPSGNIPRDWSVQTGLKYRSTMLGVVATQGIFEPQDITLAIALSMAQQFSRARNVFASALGTPNVLAQLAAEVMMGVARLAPPNAGRP